MRSCVWLLISALLFAPAANAQALDSEQSVVRVLAEVRQYDARITALQTDWDKENASIEALDSSAEKKQAAYSQATQEYTAGLAWLKHYRRQKIAEALELYAHKYRLRQNTVFWSEGSARIPNDGKADSEMRAVQLAEQDALSKAAQTVADAIITNEAMPLLQHKPIAVAVEKVAADNGNGYGKAALLKQSDASVIIAKAKIQVKPAAVNPYALAAEAMRVELAAARRELLRLYPPMVDSDLAWEVKLQTLRPSGEPDSEKQPASVHGLIANGQFSLSSEAAQQFPEAGRLQVSLVVKLPAGIDGDNAKLEVVLRDQEPKTVKRLLFSLQGQEGSAAYEYKSFTPPVISLSAGSTLMQNVRMRVGESIIRLDPEKTGIVSIELKNGELTAAANGKLTRKLAYNGKIGQLSAIGIAIPGTACLDSIKLYEDGILILSEAFTREGSSSIRLNAEFPIKR